MKISKLPSLAILAYGVIHFFILLFLPWNQSHGGSRVSPISIETAWVLIALPANLLLCFVDDGRYYKVNVYLTTFFAGGTQWYILAKLIERFTFIWNIFKKQWRFKYADINQENSNDVKLANVIIKKRHVLPLIFVFFHQIVLIGGASYVGETNLSDAFKRNFYWGFIGFPTTALVVFWCQIFFSGKYFFAITYALTLALGYLQWYVVNRFLLWFWECTKNLIRRF